MKLIDLTNKRFGRLFVVERSGTRRGQALWRCWCDCGNETEVKGYDLRNGISQSCGCLHREITSSIYKKLNLTHGMTGTRSYVSWEQMKQRCTNPNHHAWKDYGGRGIKVCPEWADFEVFHRNMGDRPEGASLDRINPNGNYEPSNCRWADVYTQATNRRERVKS